MNGFLQDAGSNGVIQSDHLLDGTSREGDLVSGEGAIRASEELV